jgi:hypothetical protein
LFGLVLLEVPVRRWVWTRLLVALVTVGVALTTVRIAEAQPGAAESQRQLLEGDRASKAGRWEEALAAYKKAHEARPSGTSAVRIAGALYQLKRVVEAHDAYELALRDFGPTVPPADRPTAQKRLEELGNQTGTLSIRVSEAGASVSIDKQAVGTSPVPARIRVLSGAHTVTVEKSGYVTFTRAVNVGPKSNVPLDALLERAPTAGDIVVNVKGNKPLRVLIDGVDVGPAPYKGALAPGDHEIAATSDTLEAAPQRITVRAGAPTVVELSPRPRMGRLEVRIKDEQGTIFVDGNKVGESHYEGEVTAGRHRVEVKRPGYAPFDEMVEVVAADVHVETVILSRSAAGEVSADGGEGSWTFDGLYGGFHLSALFLPAGSGSTLEDSCPVTGATSCDGGMSRGGALVGYIGYAFAPIGLELLVIGGGDVIEPTATFDGVHGSEINPLVAQPARDEDFIIGRAGGGGAIRLRLLVPIDRFRVSGAVGAGLAYKRMFLGRDATTADGAESSFAADSVGYLAPVVSFEIGGQVRLEGTAALQVGLHLWLEHAGDEVKTAPDPDQALVKEGAPPQPHATPAYDLASGTQLFIGPFLGMHFGP